MPKKFKHTSAPWEVKRVGMLDWHILCKSNVPNIPGVIARVGFKPNAHLIASAPELLEALKQLLSASIKNDILTRHILNAQQAIAKAEGE